MEVISFGFLAACMVLLTINITTNTTATAMPPTLTPLVAASGQGEHVFFDVRDQSSLQDCHIFPV